MGGRKYGNAQCAWYQYKTREMSMSRLVTIFFAILLFGGCSEGPDEDAGLSEGAASKNVRSLPLCGVSPYGTN